MVAVASRSLAALGERVTLVQFRVLVVLAAHQPCNLAALSSALDVHASSATRMCDRLVDRGYVTRVRSEDSRREVQLSLSAAGSNLVRQVTEHRRRELDAIAAAVPNERHAEVASALKVVLEAASEVLGASWPEAVVAGGELRQ